MKLRNSARPHRHDLLVRHDCAMLDAIPYSVHPDALYHAAVCISSLRHCTHLPEAAGEASLGRAKDDVGCLQAMGCMSSRREKCASVCCVCRISYDTFVTTIDCNL
jgi:hypothetical protein